MIYDGAIQNVVLEDEMIPVTGEPVVIAKATIPVTSAISHAVIGEEEHFAVPTTEAAIYEEIDTTVLKDAVVVKRETTTTISPALTPETEPIVHTITREEVVTTIPESDATIYEAIADSTIVDDAVVTKHTVVEESIVSPVKLDDIETIEPPIALDNIPASVHEEVATTTFENGVRKEEVEVVKKITTTIIEDDEVVLQITEHKKVTEPVYIPVVLDDEGDKTESKPEPKKVTRISTIPTTADGNVLREDPMIPTLPPMAAKGILSRLTENPYVLPATDEGRKTMATYAELNSDKNESGFDKAMREAAEIPVAPMIDISNREEAAEQPASALAPTPAPQPVPYTPDPTPTPAPTTPTEPKVIVADADVEITGGDFEEPVQETLEQTMSDVSEAAIEEIVEEPVQETPEALMTEVSEEIPEEPVEEPTEELMADLSEAVPEEPVEEPAEEITDEPVAEIVEETPDEPIEETHEDVVFTDAIHADELMTDEEAEEHIEAVEEEVGNERTGKMHAINLDTICQYYNDGDTVTLESLKEKKLVPAKMGRVKILARGTMNKKLDIIADSFSLQAVKMITLAGGRAEQYK